MAELTDLDRECLEFQEGFLSGLIAATRSQPEHLTRYSFRYASVLALLGRVSEHSYCATIANVASTFIGRSAVQAWYGLPIGERLRLGPGGRTRWQQAHTDGLFQDADKELSRIDQLAANYRNDLSTHFDAAGRRR
ncbi:hypothetical protein [Pseudarthrobacter sp. BIM B-2242]|uniref:hypothetical protein n=1 Tax=Pseudarthrobacter sp. BIM B-2242 TaxID=2772401 RepID=UPI00168AB033|nr:hypothetical protein [Pseudarthrobacter sp. BIM B-2242]QOD06012.1 hypothetical protein IDT60_20830 [Pseudarthrobacter sp. BIM B-2242]